MRTEPLRVYTCTDEENEGNNATRTRCTRGDLSIKDLQLLILSYLTSRLPTLARLRMAAGLCRGNRCSVVML